VTVTVTAPEIEANDDDLGPVDGSMGGTLPGNVLDNDTLNGEPVEADQVTLTPINVDPDSPVTLNPDGTVTVAPNTPAGEYEVEYSICEVLNPTNCDQATVTVTVTAPRIIANDDDLGTHLTSFGGLLGNILDNDLLEGARPDPADVDFELIDVDDLQGLLIDENGNLSIVPGLNPPGTYELTYRLCEVLNSTNCDTATITITLVAPKVDLSVTKTSFEAEIYEGDEFEYEIVVSNIGGTPATGVTVEDNLPSGVSYLNSTVVSVSDPQIQVSTPTINGSMVSWTVPFLPAEGVITLRLRVKAGDAGTITNVVVVNAEEEDTDDQNNRDTDVNQVLPFRIPNVITPNGDGDNDRFEIKGLGKFMASEIVIFNRYGDHVLEKKDYKNDWEAPGQVAGTYYYVLKLTDRSGRVHEFLGWIQVIKE
jgi:gliding motility-associated-like protein/uncharacterized repeat protein (TIGR01451 family)